MRQKKWFWTFLFVIFSSTLLCQCSESGVGFYVDMPQTLHREKFADFYGPQAKKNCELYRRLFAGFCDTQSQPFVTCYDINEAKYKASACQ